MRVERGVTRDDWVLSLATLAKVHGAFDMGSAEGLFGPQAIVRPTADPEVFRFGATTESVGNDVIELEERRRLAALAVRGNVGAATPVSFEDEAADGVRNVA